MTGSPNNLWKVWEQATPMERELGSEYYHGQHNRLRAIAGNYGIPHHNVIGAFAALSPNNDEDGNYRDLYAVITASLERMEPEEYNVSTYGPNKLKAHRIISGGEHPWDVLGGRKVMNFYRNTLDPRDPQPVTVDGHMVSCWHGSRLLLRRASKAGMSAVINDKEYEHIAGDVRKVAKRAGIVSCQMQATLWLAWKRIHRIRFDPQLRMFEPGHAGVEV